MLNDSALIKNHFFDPRNVGDVDSPDGVGHSGSLSCGATVRISIRVDEDRRIDPAQFKAAGCTVLVASASLLTEAIKGLTTAEAAAIARSPQTSLSALRSETSADRFGCIALACEALLAAITQYSNTTRDEWEGDEALICTCFCVSERTIEHEIQRGGLQSITQVTRSCSAGAGCGSCCSLIQELLDQYWREDGFAAGLP